MASNELQDKRYALSAESHGTPRLLSGMQALTIFPMLIAMEDAKRGWNTQGFIRGYRGSPLAGYDQQLLAAKGLLDQHKINFLPFSINEDLAAAQVGGTQQVRAFGSTLDGVYGIWYGKHPGFDRSQDPIRHAHYLGTSPRGGIVWLLGADPRAKSSTLSSDGRRNFIDLMIPFLEPSDTQDLVEYGVMAIEASRFAGCSFGLHIITDVADATGMVVPQLPNEIIVPEMSLTQDITVSPRVFGASMEKLLIDVKLPRAREFVRANKLNRITFSSAIAHHGIIAAGHAFAQLQDAFAMFGLTQEDLEILDLRIMKIAMPWPLIDDEIRRFTQGLDQIMVVEDKGSCIEAQIKAILYHDWKRIKVYGKTYPNGMPFFHEHGQLDSATIAIGLALFLGRGMALPRYGERLTDRLKEIIARRAVANSVPYEVARKPYFCPGCPHNTGLKTPDHEISGGGIGCHVMALLDEKGNAGNYTPMGGEGAQWGGIVPFVSKKHYFQNLGDGTYFHSGSLAIREVKAQGINITYKILYNSAVAMTGGQHVDGEISVLKVATQVRAEGVERIAVVSDDINKYDDTRMEFPFDTEFYPRSEYISVERSFATTKGVSVIIYDQECAAEKRRKRKRGKQVDPPKRVFINEDVCEGCGDCGAQSNCIAIDPKETTFGRKRVINPSGCNKDYSCVKGFCPSFVTVDGGKLRVHEIPADSSIVLPTPNIPLLSDNKVWSCVVPGVGGTGIVTAAQVLGQAAINSGLAVVIEDNTGLSQKGGKVVSMVRIAKTSDVLPSGTVPFGGTDVLLGCDLVSSIYPEVLAMLSSHTHIIVNDHKTPTMDFVRDPDASMDVGVMLQRLAEYSVVAQAAIAHFDLTQVVDRYVGDNLYTNFAVLGYAYQQGWVPVHHEAIEKALELNGASVKENGRAFYLGRLAAHDADVFRKLFPVLDDPTTLPELIEHRTKRLIEYQGHAYAARYHKVVGIIWNAESEFLDAHPELPKANALTVAVAKYLFKLMAYKDEYEVARLYSNGDFERRLREQFQGEPGVDYILNYHLAPPLFSKRDEEGHLKKRTFGPWMEGVYRLLAPLKFLRGTPFDIFGYTAERRQERELVKTYEQLVMHVLSALKARPEGYPTALRLLSLPEHIRGYGHVKERSIEATMKEQLMLLKVLSGELPVAAPQVKKGFIPIKVVK